MRSSERFEMGGECAEYARSGACVERGRGRSAELNEQTACTTALRGKARLAEASDEDRGA